MDDIINIDTLIEKGGDHVDHKEIIKILSKGICKEWDRVTIAMLVYKVIFGSTLCKDFCSYLVEHLFNETEKGRKWTVEQTNELARKNNIEFGADYTEFEFNAAVHLHYYIYKEDLKDSGISSDNIYAKMADSYLTATDTPKGKLVNYFFFMIRG